MKMILLMAFVVTSCDFGADALFGNKSLESETVSPWDYCRTRNDTLRHKFEIDATYFEAYSPGGHEESDQESETPPHCGGTMEDKIAAIDFLEGGNIEFQFQALEDGTYPVVDQFELDGFDERLKTNVNLGYLCDYDRTKKEGYSTEKVLCEPLFGGFGKRGELIFGGELPDGSATELTVHRLILEHENSKCTNSAHFKRTKDEECVPAEMNSPMVEGIPTPRIFYL